MKIGVDLGGTNIRAGLIDGKKIINPKAIPLQYKEDLESTLEQLKSIIHMVFNKDVKGIGLGVPSIVDLEKGIVRDVVNIPSWKEVPLRDILEKEFNVPVFINNDSNCFALGENYFGFGQQHQNFVGITLGTGIGSGIIIEDKIYSGSNCGAGEIGYLPYKEYDFEYYCGANFFTIHQTTGKQTFLEAQKNDAKALALWDEFGSHLGIALRSVVYAYDPEAIILGGAISKAYRYFENQMRVSLSNIHFPKSVERLKIYVSEIEDVGMLGAAAQVDQYLKYRMK
ncbi:MAG: ROK family protein [Cyclobacteriaceae bacterium]|jgi:glucokinase|nr:ROK family protein [Cyclobacteriaceae bacterium]